MEGLPVVGTGQQQKRVPVGEATARLGEASVEDSKAKEYKTAAEMLDEKHAGSQREGETGPSSRQDVGTGFRPSS
ncbi:hypothetical protein ColLi_12206 [Colletotrichum liriopes]|uniref:Uncharacterized protein n=1 Tax=Colletotrichum liriopes TaxID=708192 RepID=A0AA37LZE3_9PEZI|nr:hypothetical protein ColLi_12206 [Colletotrichum liriopes]